MKNHAFIVVCFLQYWASTVYSYPLRAASNRRLDLNVPKNIMLNEHSEESSFFKRAIKGLKRITVQRQGAGPEPIPFKPEDDPEWPGGFPDEEEELLINIRLDEYPQEVIVSTRVVFPVPKILMQPLPSPSKNMDSMSFAMGVQHLVPSANHTNMKGSIWTIPKSFPNKDTLYQIEIADETGDGICCGSSGNGWITVTGPHETVLWSAKGDYTYIATVYLWKESNGEFSVVYPRDSPGVAPTLNDDDTLIAVPPSSIIDTPSTTSPASSTATNAPMSCELCPGVGSRSATPEKTFDLGGYVFTCTDMEEYYLTLSSEECLEHNEEGGGMAGYASYIRALCECPGYEPSCALCNGNQVSDLDSIVPGEDFTCHDIDQAMMRLDNTKCSEVSSSTIDSYEEFCGCPGQQRKCPFNSTEESPPLDNRDIQLTVYTDRRKQYCYYLMGNNCDPWVTTKDDDTGTVYKLHGQEIVEIDHGCPGYQAVQRQGDQVCISYYEQKEHSSWDSSRGSCTGTCIDVIDSGSIVVEAATVQTCGNMCELFKTEVLCRFEVAYASEGIEEAHLEDMGGM